MHDGLAHAVQPVPRPVPFTKHGLVRRADRKRRASPPLPSRTGSPVRCTSQARNAGREPIHATIPTVTTSRRYHSLTKCEFEFCRQSLRTAFQKCTDTEFLRLSVVLSCLLHSSRALHVFEIAAVLVFHFGNETESERYDETGNNCTIQRLQAKCSQIFFFDQEGFVHFAHSLIPKFLLYYPIRGIDRSHAVLAKACVTQLELDGGIPEFSSMTTELSAEKKAEFSAYAARNWETHYRHEERRNLRVTAQVHRMLWIEVTKIEKYSGCADADWELHREAVDQVQQFCVARHFQVLGTLYRQLIAGIDARNGTKETSDKSESTSPSDSEQPVGLDRALAELELTESDSDSDGWSLI